MVKYLIIWLFFISLSFHICKFTCLLKFTSNLQSQIHGALVLIRGHAQRGGKAQWSPPYRVQVRSSKVMMIYPLVSALVLKASVLSVVY